MRRLARSKARHARRPSSRRSIAPSGFLTRLPIGMCFRGSTGCAGVYPATYVRSLECDERLCKSGRRAGAFPSYGVVGTVARRRRALRVTADPGDLHRRFDFHFDEIDVADALIVPEIDQLEDA